MIRAVLHIPGSEAPVASCIPSGSPLPRACPAFTSQQSVLYSDGSCGNQSTLAADSSVHYHPRPPDHAFPRSRTVIIRPHRDRAALSDCSQKTVSCSHREGTSLSGHLLYSVYTVSNCPTIVGAYFCTLFAGLVVGLLPSFIHNYLLASPGPRCILSNFLAVFASPSQPECCTKMLFSA
jgi:hypothetical protein